MPQSILGFVCFLKRAFKILEGLLDCQSLCLDYRLDVARDVEVPIITGNLIQSG
jgi:hypothetical protein